MLFAGEVQADVVSVLKRDFNLSFKHDKSQPQLNIIYLKLCFAIDISFNHILSTDFLWSVLESHPS